MNNMFDEKFSQPPMVSFHKYEFDTKNTRIINVVVYYGKNKKIINNLLVTVSNPFLDYNASIDNLVAKLYWYPGFKKISNVEIIINSIDNKRLLGTLMTTESKEDKDLSIDVNYFLHLRI